MGWTKNSRFWPTICLFSLSGCVHEYRPLDYDEHICMVMQDHWGWAHALNLAAKRYHVPPGLVLSVIYHESTFQSHARPERERLLGFIPWRQSSAYGYGQVKDETWDWYREKNPAIFVSRTSFHDTVQFIGWYYSVLQKKIGRRPLYPDFYIAYHDGIGGYLRGTGDNNDWLQKKAKSVDMRATSYDKQLSSCL